MLLRSLLFIGLQSFAVLMALLHEYLGVATDEAKYLLDIPYPHPPLIRWILGLSDGWQYQELFWRIVFSSLLMHCIWLVWDMGRVLTREQRVTLCGLWLFSGAFLLQAGTVMMAPVTAVQALCLCWMLTRPDMLERWSAWLGVLWLSMLFTAYQGILFMPLVFVALQKAHLPSWQRWLAFFIPLGLLGLYTLTNPLAIASMGLAGSMGVGIPLAESLTRVVRIWMLGGGLALGILGCIGMIRSRNTPLIFAFVLLVTYVFLSFRNYYAILFIPLLIAGLSGIHGRSLLRSSAFVLALQIVVGIWVFLSIPFPERSGARDVGAALRSANVGGTVLIAGSFGHEWQYELPGPVRRYRPELLQESDAVVCLQPCGDLGAELWIRLADASEEIWLRK
jgi:hypothetical protein